MKNKILFLRIGITLVVGCILYYFILPPLNLSSLDFWSFVLLIIIIYFLTALSKVIDFRTIILNASNKKHHFPRTILIIVGGFILINVINFFASPIFNSKSYASRINIDKDVTFTNDIKEVDFSSIPLIDKASSQKLGDRVMGQMPELVSQFNVSELYTQINYNDDIVRVTPLEYADIIKYFTNKSDGVMGYITVNSVNGESNLVKLDKGMQYMPSALFSKDLYRHLRFKYPTEILKGESFEIDNDGNPYWIIPTIKYTAVGLKEEVSGVIILDPITGKSNKYDLDEVPSWVDHVYNANLIIEQVNDWGKYQDGFLNAIFTQRGVVKTTAGYNYIAMNDDIYLYTGITSALADESNLGFILTNMRTKKTAFYAVAGAEEYSAMASAEGQVQQMSYQATFPLLINLNNTPTYLVSLKDNAGLVKMYGFVDVADYQKVVVTDASHGIEQASINYLSQTANDNSIIETKTIEVFNINMTMIDGNSYYYITDKENNHYRISIKVNEETLPFIKPNDKINISYTKGNYLNSIVSIN